LFLDHGFTFRAYCLYYAYTEGCRLFVRQCRIRILIFCLMPSCVGYVDCYCKEPGIFHSFDRYRSAVAYSKYHNVTLTALLFSHDRRRLPSCCGPGTLQTWRSNPRPSNGLLSLVTPPPPNPQPPPPSPTLTIFHPTRSL
jgi:hypothetical protein